MLTALLQRERWLPLSRRSTDLELLDGGLVGGTELGTNLEDLARLNRLPGGAGASTDAISRIVAGRSGASVLDVGTGAGDLAAAFAARGWRVVALDADAAVLDVARTRTAHVPAVELVQGVASALPFDDASMDVVHASLLAHHLDPAAAIGAFSEMARVARLGVVINDLRRGILPLLATAVAVTVLGRCRTTRHDGLLSVRRAYTGGELGRLLEAAGLLVVRRSAPWMPRVVTTSIPVRAA